MFGRGRPRRVYRVYADDEFLGPEELGADDLGLPHADDGAPIYTAPPRRLSGAIGGRWAGIAVLAVVAMAVSAIVVHALRSGLVGGGEAGRPAVVAGARTIRQSAPATPRAVRRTGAAPGPSPGPVSLKIVVRRGRAHAPVRAPADARAEATVIAAAQASSGDAVVAVQGAEPSSGDALAAVGSTEPSPGAPEFEFER
jgi:hypothetical protein